MEKPLYIAAIDLGTYKIVGAIAEKKEDGRIELLALEKVITRKGSIVKGRINDLDDILFQINAICKKLHNQTKIAINRLHLSCSGLLQPNQHEKWAILVNQLQQKKIEVIECNHTLTQEANLVLTPEEKETGSIYINMGAGTTTFLFHKEGEENIQGCVKIGGGLITNDLTYLNLSEEEAERLKRKLGDVQSKRIANPGTIIGLSKNDSHGTQRSISLGQLSQMIEERIIEWANKIFPPFIENGSFERGKTQIVLTGGSAALRHLTPWIEEYTHLPVRLADLSEFVENAEDYAKQTGLGYTTLLAMLISNNTHCVKVGASPFTKIKNMVVKNGNKLIDHGITELFPVDNQ